jgi:wobble nucleotide-excising tRNase
MIDLLCCYQIEEEEVGDSDDIWHEFYAHAALVNAQEQADDSDAESSTNNDEKIVKNMKRKQVSAYGASRRPRM